MTKGENMEQEYNFFIVDNGVRIGFYHNENDIREGINHCNRGFIMSRKEWEQRHGG